MSPRPAQAVGRVDGGGRQGLVEAEPEVDAGEVHHYGHTDTVGVGVKVGAKSHDHPVLQHLSDWGSLQSEYVGGGGQDHSNTPSLRHGLHPRGTDLAIEFLIY